MRRFIALVTFGLLVLAGLHFALPSLLEALLVRALANRGLGPARLEVASLGYDHLELRAVELGPHSNLRVARARAEVAWRDLAVGSLVVEDLELNDRHDERGSWLEAALAHPADPKDPAESESSAVPFPIPQRIRLRPVRVRIDTPRGVLTGGGGAEFAATTQGGLEGNAEATLSLSDHPIAELALVASSDLVALQIDALIGADTLRALGVEGVERLRLEGSVEAPPEARQDLALLLGSAEGQVLLEAEIERNEIRGSGVGHVEFDAGDLSLAFEAEHLRFARGDVEHVRLNGRLAVQPTPTGVEASTPECLRWQVEGVRLAAASAEEEFRAAAPWSGCFAGEEGPLLRADRLAVGWQVALAGRSRDGRIAIRRGGDLLAEGELPDIVARLRVPPEGDAHARLEIHGGDLIVGGGLARVSELRAEVSGDLASPVPLGASVTLVEAEDEGEMLRIRGELDPTTSPYDFRLDLADEAGTTLARGSGRFEPERRAGTLDVALGPLIFESGGRQPSDYRPGLLDGLGEFEGSVSGAAAVALEGGRLATSGEIEVRDGGLRGGTLLLEGVDGTLRFRDLLPLTTAPGQALHFESATAGVALRRGRLELEVGPGWSTVRVPSLTGDLLGGRVRATADLDLASQQHVARVELEDVQLGDVIAVVGREDLSATGRLAGQLPIELRDGQLGIREGLIQASPPEGRLRYKPSTPPAALAGAGEYGELALRALEDFHYEALELRIEVEPGQESHVLLSLRGANPEVQDGQPIHLNLDLSGALIEVLQSDPRMSRLVDRLSRDALDRTTP